MEYLVISSYSELIVSGSTDGIVRDWRASTGGAVRERLASHNGSITRVAVNEEGNRSVSCSEDDDVRLWDSLSGEVIGIPLRGY